MIPTSQPVPASKRLVSLDVLRGLIIAAMILVNTPGNGDTTYWPLKHSDWNGWTPTDLIFPSFLFMMGVAMTFSFPSRLARGATPGAMVKHIIIRSAALFAIGLIVNAFPQFDLHTWRIPGVLQRFALCYLFAGLLLLFTRRENGRANVPVIATFAVVFLIAYWAILKFVPVPGYGVGHLDPQGNLGAYIDRALMSGHLWGASKTWDPEGLLSTLPAVSSVLLGILSGEWLRSKNAPMRKAAGLIIAGLVLMALGEMLHPYFPINKKLWTSTFVLFTGGFTSFSLGVFYWILDIRQWKGWIMPTLVFGTNSILAYALSELIDSALDWGNVHERIYHGFFVPMFSSPYNASLAYAICYVLLIFLLVLPLYLKRIFVKL